MLVLPDRIRAIPSPDRNREVLEASLQPFERATPMKRSGSLGPGLSIVRRILEAHGGRISVQSEPGRGSCFTGELPVDGPAESKGP